MIQVRPVGNMVLVQADPPALSYGSGLLIPSAYLEKPLSGLVLDLGLGAKDKGQRLKVPVRAGQRVMFNKNSGWRFKPTGRGLVLAGVDDELGAEDVLLIDWHDILCTLSDAKEPG